MQSRRPVTIFLCGWGLPTCRLSMRRKFECPSSGSDRLLDMARLSIHRPSGSRLGPFRTSGGGGRPPPPRRRSSERGRSMVRRKSGRPRVGAAGRGMVPYRHRRTRENARRGRPDRQVEIRSRIHRRRIRLAPGPRSFGRAVAMPPRCRRLT